MEASASFWHVVVAPKSTGLDGHGRSVLHDVHQLGLPHITAVRSSRVYLLSGQLNRSAVERLADELLVDPVAETGTLAAGLSARENTAPSIEVHYRPGVMNPAALSTLDAARRLLRNQGPPGARIDDVATARRYEISGAASADELEQIARQLLANECIERAYIDCLGRIDAIPDEWPAPPQRPFVIRSVAIRWLNDEALVKLSREAHLFLSLSEMRAIRDHYVTLGRDPTDLELETLAQTWSEHCVHKTLKSAVDYAGADFGRDGAVTRRFDNLLKETIVHATKSLDRPWCLSVFVDNAGVIAFDDDHGIAFKVETHNHPSAIEPYGGAATGVGGCIRDIMGCGLGAKPIASTDVFCVAPEGISADRLPKDVLHPARVLKGVVSGVRDYGNRMGIPTVNGAIYFHEQYLANPLVFCGCVGLIPKKHIRKQPNAGDCIVVAGGRTGRDGIHGATFSSAELTDTHADEFAHAVQIGNAIVEKKLLDAMLLARNHAAGPLYSSVTDCGAGGLSSAVGEMGEHLGAIVDLEKVPLKYAGLRYDEIWISEAQERMVFAVPPAGLAAFLALFAAEEVEATVIGAFTDDHRLHVRYNAQTVGELSMDFLHQGLPRSTRRAVWNSPRSVENSPKTMSTPPRPIARAESLGREPDVHQGACIASAAKTESETAAPSGVHSGSPPYQMQSGDHSCSPPYQGGARGGPAASYPDRNHRRPVQDSDPAGTLLRALRHPNVASKEWVIRQYDHEVQGRSVIKPLIGPGDGPSDAAVLRPLYASDRGIAIACGLCPELGDGDPYWMAVLAVDEALRNVLCVGADIEHTAILDNFCWPKVDTPESLGTLVRACQGAADAALAYGLPFISGKDSLNNEFSMSEVESQRTGWPRRIAIPPTLLISSLGIVEDVRRCVSMDLKRSGNALVLASAPVDECGLSAAFALHQQVSSLIRGGKVLAAHDVSDGGLGVAVAEMMIAGNLGVDLDFDPDRAPLDLLENRPTTYVLEMSETDARDCGFQTIGSVRDDRRLTIRGNGALGGATVGNSVDLPLDDLIAAWRGSSARQGD